MTEGQRVTGGRIAYLDVARGIGILLVVLGHNDLALVSPFLQRFIYSFHVPLFFCLSGYFLDTGIPFTRFLVKRFNSTLKPYLFTIFLLYVISVSFSGMSFATALGRIAKAMYGTGPYIDWAPLWFLPSLFVTGLFAFLLQRLLLQRITSRPLRWLALLGVAGIGAYSLGAFYPYALSAFGKEYALFGLPYSLDLVLLTGSFYLMGNEFHQARPEKLLENPWLLLGAGAILAGLALAVPQTIDLHARQFPSFPVDMLRAVLGILFTLAVSRQIDLHLRRLSRPLAYIGGASLSILILHMPIQEYWNAKILAGTGSQPFATLAAFLVSVGFSLAFYRAFVESNPVASRLFGRKPSPSEKAGGG